MGKNKKKSKNNRHNNNNNDKLRANQHRTGKPFYNSINRLLIS